MPRFFCEEISPTNAVITGEDARHIAKVLRMGPGEGLTLCDMRGSDYACTILSAQPDRVELRVDETLPCATEPTLKVRLFMALPKGDKFELIVQKAVELGVDEIIPVLTKRCVSRPDAKSMEKKLVRYNRVAYEAAKQSMRGKIPAVLPLRSFEEAIAEMGESDAAILFYERSTAPMQEVLAGVRDSLSIMVGAEGGFEEEEVAYAAARGVHTLTLGKRILRCETAPLAALSVVMYATGNLE